MNFTEFAYKLQELELGTKKISNITNITFSTIVNWSAKRNNNQLPSSAKYVELFWSYANKIKK